jgi:cyclase
MLRSRIIPSLLIHDRGLVKTCRFSDHKYVGDPINAVKIFNEKQVDELAIFDIDATVEGRGPDFNFLRGIAVESRMPLCYGGGVRSTEDAIHLVSLGFEKVSISASALERPSLIEEISQAIGSQSVVVTLDVKRSMLGKYEVYSHNGRKKSKVNLMGFVAQAEAFGAGEVVINSIDRDGMMEGYDLVLAQKIRAATTGPLTFLGGAGSIAHLQALIDEVGIVGAAAGSLFVFKGTYRAVLITYSRP